MSTSDFNKPLTEEEMKKRRELFEERFGFLPHTMGTEDAKLDLAIAEEIRDFNDFCKVYFKREMDIMAMTYLQTILASGEFILDNMLTLIHSAFDLGAFSYRDALGKSGMDKKMLDDTVSKFVAPPAEEDK